MKITVSASLLAITTGLLVTGCVKRTILVESDPPGATVWINEHQQEAVTPLAYEFITHGRYKFRLEKKGFQELTAREMVWAPIYQWIPLDFISENLLPIHFEDKHLFRYKLSPQPPMEQLQLEREIDLEQILADLKDPHPAKRQSACIELARRRDPATARPVFEALHDHDATVRAVALEAWRGIQGPPSLDELLKALRLDPSPQVRWQAAVELEALASHAAVPALIEALHDKSHLVRTGAAEALKGIPDPRALKALIRALKDKDTAVRRAATEGLGLIGDRTAVPALTKVLFHHDVHTRRKAAEALARLKDPASGIALVRTFADWDPQVRRIATQALISFGDSRVVPLLIRWLRGLKPWTREHAAQVLGGLKDPRALEPLSRALRRETDPPASAAMYDALLAMGAHLDDSWAKTVAYRIQKAEEMKAKPKKKREYR